MDFSKTTCSICGQESDGQHFGIEACRACAAFFRRTVSTAKKYVCRIDGNCPITRDIRWCCACRYTKCIQLGMNPSSVQQRRDIIGKRIYKVKKISREKGEREEPDNKLGKMPILEKMEKYYTEMVKSRLIIHRREGENCFKPRIPRNLTYKETAIMTEKEVQLVSDWLSCCFDDFITLPSDQKQILFSNFFMGFILLQGAYTSHISNRDDVIIVASGDYIDMKDLRDYYRDYEYDKDQKISSEQAVKLFQNSYEAFRRSLIQPLMQQNVDIFEFLALCTLSFWDFDLDGQSDECVEIGRKVREKVLKELVFYLQIIRKLDEPSIKIGTLMTILPSIQKLVRKFREDVEVSNVFNVFAVPEKFYKLYMADSFDKYTFKC